MPIEYGVLVLVGDSTLEQALCQRLHQLGYHPLALEHPRQALEATARQPWSAAILNAALPEIGGSQLARMLRLRVSELAVLIVANGKPEDGVQDEVEEHDPSLVWLTSPTVADLESALEQAIESHPATNGEVETASGGYYGQYVG